MAFFSMLSKFLGLLTNNIIFVRLFLILSCVAIALYVAQMNRLTMRNPIINYLVSFLAVFAIWEVLTMRAELLEPRLAHTWIRLIAIFGSALISLGLSYILYRRLLERFQTFKIIALEELHIYRIFILISAILLIVTGIFILQVVLSCFPYELIISANYISFMLIGLVSALMAYLSKKISFYLVVSGLSGLAIAIGDEIVLRMGAVDDKLIRYLLETETDRVIMFTADRKILAVNKEKILQSEGGATLTMVVTADKYEIETERFIWLLFNKVSERIRRDYILRKKLLVIRQKSRLIESVSRLLQEEIMYILRTT